MKEISNRQYATLIDKGLKAGMIETNDFSSPSLGTRGCAVCIAGYGHFGSVQQLENAMNRQQKVGYSGRYALAVGFPADKGEVVSTHHNKTKLPAAKIAQLLRKNPKANAAELNEIFQNAKTA